MGNTFFYIFLTISFLSLIVFVKTIINDIRFFKRVKEPFLSFIMFSCFLYMMYASLYLVPYISEDNRTYIPLEFQMQGKRYVEVVFDDERILLEIPEKLWGEDLYMELEITHGFFGNKDCLYGYGINCNDEFIAFKRV